MGKSMYGVSTKISQVMSTDYGHFTESKIRDVSASIYQDRVDFAGPFVAVQGGGNVCLPA